MTGRPPNRLFENVREIKKKLRSGSQQSGYRDISDPDHTATFEDEQRELLPPHAPIFANSDESKIPAGTFEENTTSQHAVRARAPNDAAVAPEDAQQVGNANQPGALVATLDSRRTPILKEVLKDLETKYPEAYGTLKQAVGDAVNGPSQAANALAGDGEAMTKFRSRLKKYQSTIAALRGISMSIADLDPHKIAPLICASVFFSMDIALNNMHEEDRNRIRDILLNCDKVVTDGMTFEKYFTRKEHRALADVIPNVLSELKALYEQALRLVSKIYAKFNKEKKEAGSRRERAAAAYRERVDRISVALTQKIDVWESENKDLAAKYSNWTERRKDLDYRLSEVKETKEVRDWIKKEDDPEPELDTLSAKAMPDGKYKDAAAWFLEHTDYRSWRDAWLGPTEPVPHPKRVLWLNGTYGTGKTTVMFHTYSALMKELPNDPEGGAIRVIPYFCDASATSTRPDYETILRALLWHLALLPGASLAPDARKEYERAQNRKSASLDVSSWEKLFSALLDASTDDKFVFLVDALDECMTRGDGDRFLRFMADKVISRQNTYLLCSSHKHVAVDRYFHPNHRYNIAVSSEDTLTDMKKFIDGELESRKRYSEGSAFYGSEPQDEGETLLETLRTKLLKHSKGMFRWVQIWLDICLPQSTSDIIEDREIAKDYLKKMEKDGSSDVDSYDRLKRGYQRLWEFNRPIVKRDQESRIRLFHIALAALRPLTVDNIKDALAIGEKVMGHRISDERLRQLCSSFLDISEIRKGFRKGYYKLRWVHASAERFISEMTVTQCQGTERILGGDERKFTETNNHRPFAEMFVNVVGNSNHPLWTEAWRRINGEYNPCKVGEWMYYKKLESSKPDLDSPLRSLRRNWEKDTLLRYLVKYGLLHCDLAAEKKSMFDPLWTEVLDKVVLNPSSAFGFTIMLKPSLKRILFKTYGVGPMFPFETSRNKDLGLLHEDEKGNLGLLYSHVLARLNIIHQDDVARLSVDASNPRLRLLFEHSAYIKDRFDFSHHGDKMGPLDYGTTETALHIATKRGNVAAVEMILESRRLGMNKPRISGRTFSNRENDSIALWHSATQGHYAVVDLLLETSEADIEWRPESTNKLTKWDAEDGETLLKWATRHTDDVLISLLKRKASSSGSQANSATRTAERMQRAERYPAPIERDWTIRRDLIEWISRQHNY